MTRIAKFVAPLALFATFGAAQAGELVKGDFALQPIMVGTAAKAEGRIVGAPHGEAAFGQPGTVAAPVRSGAQTGSPMMGGKVVQPTVVGA